MRSAILRWALGAALIGTALPGCTDNKNEIARGRRFAQQGNYAEAHKAFDQALAADPKDYNALWGKADTFRREGNLARQAELLERVTGDEALNKAYAGVVQPALEENYRKQAEQKMSEPAQAEAFLLKAIALNKKSEANVTLANLLYKQAKEAQDKGDFKTALEIYGKTKALRMPRPLRRKIAMQTEISEFRQFTVEFEPTWARVKPKLIEAGQYDEKTDTIFVTAVVEVEGDPKDEGYEQSAERQALGAVTDALNSLTWQVAEQERPEGASVQYAAAVVSVVEKGFTADKKPARFGFRISLPRDAVIEKAGKVIKGEFQKAGEKAPEEGAEAPKDDGDAPKDDAEGGQD